jgi:hypothetical protein
MGGVKWLVPLLLSDAEAKPRGLRSIAGFKLSPEAAFEVIAGGWLV